MSDINSKKVTLLNFMLSLLIVLLHCDNRNVINYSFSPVAGYTTYIDLLYNIINKICETAVPTFFALSGYLFFRNRTDLTVLQKWKRRFRTVLLPYLIWNGIFYLPYFAIGNIPSLAEKINLEVPPFNIYDWLFANYANPPLWFLRKLFVLQLISPVVYFLFKKLKWGVMILFIGIAMLDIVFQFGYSSILHWIPVYFGAGAISLYRTYEVEMKLNDSIKKHKFVATLLSIILFLIGSLTCLQWIVAPIVWLIILSMFDNVFVSKNFKLSFFIFLTHYFTILIIRKVFVLLLGVTPMAMLVSYILTFVISIIVLTVIGNFIHDKLPRTYNLLCGGR